MKTLIKLTGTTLKLTNFIAAFGFLTVTVLIASFIVFAITNGISEF